MDAQHRDSNLGSAEVQKRALAASASKATHQENAQKPKGSAVEVQIVPQDLFGDKPAGSVHAPAVQAVLANTSNNKGGPQRPTNTSIIDQQAAQQSASVLPLAADGSPAEAHAQQMIRGHLTTKSLAMAPPTR